MIIPIGFESEDIEEPRTRTPWMTIALILVSVGTHILHARLPEAAFESYCSSWGYHADSPFGVGLFTSLFVHADAWHLVGNMTALLLFGSMLEMGVGPAALLVIYGISGCCGSWVQGAMTRAVAGHALPCAIGASGAIMGVVGAAVAMMSLVRVEFAYWIFIWIGRFHVPVWLVGLGYFAEDFAASLVAQRHAGGGVGFASHSGGFLAGALFALALVPLIHHLEQELRERLTAKAPVPVRLARQARPAQPASRERARGPRVSSFA